MYRTARSRAYSSSGGSVSWGGRVGAAPGSGQRLHSPSSATKRVAPSVASAEAE